MSLTRFELHSATETGSGNGVNIDSQSGGDVGSISATVALNVSAASGTTPTLDVTVEGKFGGTFHTIATFTQVAGVVAKEIKEIPGCPEVVRAVFVIAGGTPSYTFDVQMIRA